MHAGAGLGDDALLAHALRQQDLAEHVVDLVGAGVIELLALQINFCSAARKAGGRLSAMRRQTLGEIERRRAANIVREIAIHLLFELWIGLGLERKLLPVPESAASAFRRQNGRHRCRNDRCSSGPVRKEFGCWTVMRKLINAHHRDRVAMRASRGTNEVADLVGMFFTRSAFDSGRDIDAGRGGSQGFVDIAGSSPPDSMTETSGSRFLRSRPVERLTQTAWPGRVVRRPRIKQNAVGDGGIDFSRGEVASGRDPNALIAGSPKRA